MATTDRLQEPFKTDVENLIAEAAQLGVTVTLSSGFRTREQQIALRRAHCGTSQYDIYDKPSSQCSPPTARPGTSMHEVGWAVDFTNTDAVIAMVESLAPRYRMHRTVAGERWHYEPTYPHSNAAGSTTAPADPAGATATGSAPTSGGGGLGGAVAKALDPDTWRRLGLILGGVLVALVGAYLILGDALPIGKNLARTLTQGAKT